VQRSPAQIFGLVLGFGVAIGGAIVAAIVASELWVPLLFSEESYSPGETIAWAGFSALTVYVIFLAILVRQRWETPALSRWSLRQLLVLMLSVGPAVALLTAPEVARAGENPVARGIAAVVFSLAFGGWELRVYFRRSDPEQNPAFFFAVGMITFSTAWLGAATMVAAW